MEQVVLVNSKDQELGVMEKLEAHRTGTLHRAFSILLFNNKREILLQKRASHKYHSGGLWTNTCCSHPKPGEMIQDAAERRLKEEMGIILRPDFAYKFIYKTTLDNNLIEHEYDHVFIGNFDDKPSVNDNEVEDWKYMALPQLRKDIVTNPDRYTVWFKIIIEQLDKNIFQPIA